LARQLSQQEIDAVFESAQDRKREVQAVRFDFRRPDRIPKSQVRAIHLLHDTFVRNLVSSLSAYLRSYLAVNLVSVEQLSYAEFLDGLPSPTCMVSLGLKPYDGQGVLELNPSLVFPILEMLLGGTGKTTIGAVASSVWGQRLQLGQPHPLCAGDSWKNTVNNLERVLATRGYTFAFLNEGHHINARDLVDAIFMINEGRARAVTPRLAAGTGFCRCSARRMTRSPTSCGRPASRLNAPRLIA